jgi:ankyrin repeat protein
MQQQSEMQQRTEMQHQMMLNEATARCRQYRTEYEDVRMELEIFRFKMELLEQKQALAEEREVHAELEKQATERFEMKAIRQQQMRQREAQAAMEQQMEAVQAHHEEAAAARHEELMMRYTSLEARAREEQQIERKQERELAEPRQQSAEKREGHAAYSAEDQEGQAVFNSSRQADRDGRVPVLSDGLQAWLARHNLVGVYERDRYGWSALHHVAMDSKIEIAAAGIMEELGRHNWSPEQLDAVGAAPESEHSPREWTALHILANGLGTQRGRLAQRLLALRADPMPLTARGATPLHMAAATGNLEVAQVLLRAPGVDVNVKNKDDKTPYDLAISNRRMQDLIACARGLASSNQTGFSSREG